VIFMTPDEIEFDQTILKLRLQGWKNKDIAAHLGVHENTVLNHWKKIKDEWKDAKIDYESIVEETLASLDMTKKEAWKLYESTDKDDVKMRAVLPQLLGIIGNLDRTRLEVVPKEVRSADKVEYVIKYAGDLPLCTKCGQKHQGECVKALESS